LDDRRDHTSIVPISTASPAAMPVCQRAVEAPPVLQSPPSSLLRPLAEYEAAIGGSF